MVSCPSPQMLPYEVFVQHLAVVPNIIIIIIIIIIIVIIIIIAFATYFFVSHSSM